MIQFRIIHTGGSRAKGNSKRVFNGRIVQAKSQVLAEKKLRAESYRHRPDEAFGVPVIVDYTWAFKIPKSGDNRHRRPGDEWTGRTDADNLAKMINDALQPHFFVDDRWVIPGRWRRIWDLQAYTEVRIRRAVFKVEDEG